MIKSFCHLLLLLLVTSISKAQSLQKLYPVSFSEVTIDDTFCSPKLKTVVEDNIKSCINYTKHTTSHISNFERAATHNKVQHVGIYYVYSDVYKALDAMAYSLRNNPDVAIENKSDEWIDKIVAAQLPDGYLNTY